MLLWVIAGIGAVISFMFLTGRQGLIVNHLPHLLLPKKTADKVTAFLVSLP